MNDNSFSDNQSPLAPAQSPATVASVAPPAEPASSSPIPSGSVTVGGPETAPAKSAAAEQQKAPEYGYERIKQIESGAEQAEKAIERKDNKQIQAPQRPVVKKEPLIAKPAQPQGPKFYGYKVSPTLANDFHLIASQKGKGDTESSKTWIFMLLDRLLKKQTLNG